MKNGDLEKQPETLNTVTASIDAVLGNAEPAATESTASEPATIASEPAMIASEPAMTAGEPAMTAGEPKKTASEPAKAEPVVMAPAPVVKESLWQRLRKQPRETAAVVVIVVTAFIWLDSGDSNSQKGKTSNSPDPMDGFESYLADFETEESGTPLRESADPVENPSTQTMQSEFASAVTANYGDSVIEPSDSSNKGFATSTSAAQYPAAQYPADAEAFGSPAPRANAGNAATDMNNFGSQQNRRVRFAGRIKPAN